MVKKINPDVAERNLTLLGRLMNYIIDHPKILEELPEDFELVILPEDDPEMTLYNLELLKKYGRQNKPVVLARVKSSGEQTISAPNLFVPIAA